MRTLGNRRAVLSAGVAVVAAVALAGCSAGQVAETAIKRSSSQGVTENNSNNTVGIRNLAVTYNGPTGVPAGGNAPLEVGIFNLTTQEVTVLISSTPTTNSIDQTVVSGTSVQLFGVSGSESASATPAGSGAPSAEPSGGAPSAEPSASAPAEQPAGGQPARMVIPPLGSVSFLPGGKEQLVVVGLTKALLPASAVNVTFEFSTGAQPLTLPAPVAPPLSPGPRGSGIPDENTEG